MHSVRVTQTAGRLSAHEHYVDPNAVAPPRFYVECPCGWHGATWYDTEMQANEAGTEHIERRLRREALKEECEYCDDEGACVGCGGTGVHPLAGKGNPQGRDFVATNQNCSWCEGTGACSADASHRLVTT